MGNEETHADFVYRYSGHELKFINHYQLGVIFTLECKED